MMRKELQVAALKNGTAIDHIPSDKLFKVVSLLQLDKLDKRITFGNNLESKKMGKKGIIKVEDTFFEEDEINRIALISPKVKLNIIKEYEVIEKKNVMLPDSVCQIVKCTNPKCISNNEPMETRFEIIDKEKVTLKCYFCEVVIKKDEIILQ